MLPVSLAIDSSDESSEPFRILLALSDSAFGRKCEAICRSRYWLVVEPTPVRAMELLGSAQFNVVAVDLAATFNSWENVLRAAARLSPFSGRLLLFDDGTGRPLPPASPWLYHDTLDKRAEPNLIVRRLNALCAGAATLGRLPADPD